MAGSNYPDARDPADAGREAPKSDLDRSDIDRPDLRPDVPGPQAVSGADLPSAAPERASQETSYQGAGYQGASYVGTFKPAMSYQGIGIRFVSILIDSIVLAIVFAILGVIFGVFNYQVNSPGLDLYGGESYGILSFIIYIAYYTLLEGSTGQTIGKMITKIRVVKEDGSKMDMGPAFVRNLLRIVDALPVSYLVGALLIWYSKKEQRLGDMIAKTVVIKA